MTTLSKTREALLVEHAAARQRRAEAPLGGEAYQAALIDIARIEVEVARIERAMKPPLG
jgi:hypothetical protein